MSLFSAPGSVLLKSLQRCCSLHTDLTLIKTSTDNSAGKQHPMLGQSNFQSLYTSGKAYGNLVLQATLPGVKKPLCVASAFLGKCASIIVVDLI